MLFTVNDSPVYVDEFHRVYNKNIDLIKDSDQRDIQNYLDLFINYKLKLAEAYSLDLHKENAYLKELNKYAKQLQNSYLTDKETEEIIPSDTPEDVWDLLQEYEKKKKK